MCLHFPKQKRLLTHADYAYVFQQALPAVSPRLTLLARANQLGYPRLGLVIAKKQLKRAVARNRCKRLLRESFRQQQHLPSMDFVAIAKKGMDSLDNAELIALINKLWRRFCR